MAPFTFLLATAGLALAAQPRPDVLEHLPAQAKAYRYYPNPAASRRAFLATAQLFPAKGKERSFVGREFETHWGLDLDAFNGGVLLAEFEGEPGHPSRLLVLGARNPMAILKGLKARKDGDGWSYRLGPSGEKAGAERYGAVRKGLLFLSDHRERLTPPEAVEDVALLRPWISGMDLVMGTTRHQMAAGLAQARLGMAALQADPPRQGEADSKTKGAAANLAIAKPILQMLEPFVAKLQASADRAALGVGFRPEGVRVKGQVFFKAGSPLGAETAAVPAGTRLQGLTGADHVLAGGFSGPALIPLTSLGAGMIRALAGEKIDKALLARWEGSQAITSQGLRNIAWAVALPTQAGAPWLSGIHSVMKVADARAHLAAMAEGQELSAQLLKALPVESGRSFAMTLQRDILPGVPSLGLSMDLTDLAGEKGMPPQAGPAMTMMLGSPRFQISYGALDDTTIVMAVGDAEGLKTTLARVKTGQSLEAQPAVQKALGLLPEGAMFQMLLSPAGFAQATKKLMATFGAPQPVALPACSDAQIAMAVYWTAEGIRLNAIAPAAALQDLGGLFKVINTKGGKPPIGTNRGK